MTTLTTNRTATTGRPLGVLDVLSKIADTALNNLKGLLSSKNSHADGSTQAAILQANALRHTALQLRKQDPRYAAELMAAADRHELQAKA